MNIPWLYLPKGCLMEPMDNTHFSPQWWDKLTDDQKNEIYSYVYGMDMIIVRE